MRLRFVAAATALVLVLSGCAMFGPSKPANTLKPVTSGEIPVGAAKFYSQTVSWKACGGAGTFCGDVIVPANWLEPTGATIKIAVAYHEAEVAKSLGSVIINPGGPGTSGVTWITQSVNDLVSAKLRKNFNIVSFDPRGVGQSEPRIKCLSNKDKDQMIYGDSGLPMGSPEDIAYDRKWAKKLVDACFKNTGNEIRYVDTVQTAQDLDVIRAVFGDAKINYLGFSYGTFLGETYAALFTDRVSKMVLDGVIDPTVSQADQNYTQMLGFDQALRNFLADCLESKDCPFHGTVAEAQTRIAKLLLSIESKPLKTDSNRELTIWGAINGLIMPLYGKDWWPTLSQAFKEALAGDGTTFLSLADMYNDRNEDGTYGNNLIEANIAISCLDARESADAASMAKQNARVLAGSEVFGRYWINGAIGCEPWPQKVSKEPKSYAAKTWTPILVLGTKGDPATPYSQAVSTATKVLPNAILVTFNGEGHTAYSRGNVCIDNTVDDYFIKNVVPTEDPDC